MTHGEHCSCLVLHVSKIRSGGLGGERGSGTHPGPSRGAANAFGSASWGDPSHSYQTSSLRHVWPLHHFSNAYSQLPYPHPNCVDISASHRPAQLHPAASPASGEALQMLRRHLERRLAAPFKTTLDMNSSCQHAAQDVAVETQNNPT